LVQISTPSQGRYRTNGFCISIVPSSFAYYLFSDKPAQSPKAAFYCCNTVTGNMFAKISITALYKKDRVSKAMKPQHHPKLCRVQYYTKKYVLVFEKIVFWPKMEIVTNMTTDFVNKKTTR